MPTRPALNRADLLACLQAYGEAHLDASASVLGYARRAPTPPVPPPPPQAAAAVLSAPAAARPTPVPRLRFPRVVVQRRLEAAEARRDEPQWYRDAVPVAPRPRLAALGFRLARGQVPGR